MESGGVNCFYVFSWRALWLHILLCKHPHVWSLCECCLRLESVWMRCRWKKKGSRRLGSFPEELVKTVISLGVQAYGLPASSQPAGQSLSERASPSCRSLLITRVYTGYSPPLPLHKKKQFPLHEFQVLCSEESMGMAYYQLSGPCSRYVHQGSETLDHFRIVLSFLTLNS